MTIPEVTHVGTQLDQDHAPETNGRMAVCRKCGARTDSPEGLYHVPSERELARSSSWLDGQVQRKRIEQARERHWK